MLGRGGGERVVAEEQSRSEAANVRAQGRRREHRERVRESAIARAELRSV